MSFDARFPGPPLSRYVAVLWHCQEYASPHAFERVLPDGRLQLLIPLGDQRLHAYDHRNIARFDSYRIPLICGARSEFAVVDAASQRSLMGVQFREGGAFALLGVPAGALHNRHLSLDEAWGRHANELHDRLLNAKTAQARFQILEATLLQYLHRAPELPAAVRYALSAFDRSPHDLAIGAVCTAVGLSPRRFIELFADYVGMTPKRYCRVRRFRTALRFIEGQAEVDWALTAHACGYFDQSHFIRDFRAFTGVPPTTYLYERTQHSNHLRFSA